MNFVPDSTHDFVDVEDVVTGLLTLSKIRATGIHELGKGVPYTNDSVRLIVEDVTGKKANITSNVKLLRGYDTGDWFCKQPSQYWSPTKTLRTSIEEMVEEYRLTRSKKES